MFSRRRGRKPIGRRTGTQIGPATAILVFPGRDEGEPLNDIAGLWNAVRDAGKLEDVTLHGLRHSFASVGANRGLAHELIG